MIWKAKTKNTIKIKTQKYIKALGLYQIIGGLIGFVSIGIQGFSLSNDKLLCLLLPGALLFGFSIYVGIQAYLQSKNCLNLTIINQLMQLVGIYIGHYGFAYVSGLGLDITIDLSEHILFGMSTTLSTLNYRLGLEPEKYVFSFNIVSILIIYYAEKFKKNEITKE